MDERTEIILQEIKTDLLKQVKGMDVSNPFDMRRKLPKIQESIDRLIAFSKDLS